MATSQKKGTSKKSSSQAKKKTTAKKQTKGKSNAARSARAAKAATNTQNKQLGAVILFAVSILLLFITIIPGGNVWAAIQAVIFGLFGICAYVWPLILIYVAIMTSLDKDGVNLKTKVLEAAVLVLLACSAVFIFAGDGTVSTYTKEIADAYELGKNTHNGGAFGAIFGALLLMLFGGKVPAAITIIIAIFVALMVISGTTLTGLFDGIWQPIQKAGTATGEHFEERAKINEEKRAERLAIRDSVDKKNHRFSFNPDVDLGPDPDEDSDIVDETMKKEMAITNGYKSSSKKQPKKKVNENASRIYAFSDDPVLTESTDDSIGFEDAPAKNNVVELNPKAKEEPAPEVRIDDIVKKAASRNLPPVEEKPEKVTLDKAVADATEAELQKASEAKPAEEKKVYRLPPYDCLKPAKISLGGVSEGELRDNANRLVEILQSFGVKTTLIDISRGPSVTRYELAPAAGVKINKITGLADDIALNLAASGVRIAPVPGKTAVGIEVPNRSRDTVTLRELLESPEYKKAASKSRLTVSLGRDIGGNVCTTDIAKMPHLLIAGTTGSGKSVCLNAMILSILYNATPDEVKLIMIDPKKVEFSVYNGIPHLLIPVVADPHKAAGALAWAVKEMLNRYKTFSENNVRDIRGYNDLVKNDPEKPKMPEIVIFIDELADLMMATPKEVEDSICRLAQMARAAGMHLIIATQRPSVDVITGLIKANIPSRLSLSVSSAVDSRTILDQVGAEKLLGNGDLLFNPVGQSKPLRIQGCFTSDAEVENVVEFIKKQETTEYDESIIEEIEKQATAAENANSKGGAAAPAGEAGDGDELLSDAIQVVVEMGSASTTLLQRKLKVGYARAARIIDELEERGVVGPYEGSKPRKVLITKAQWLEQNALAGDDDGTAAAMDMGIED